MKKNILNKDEKEEYISKYFKDEGYHVFETYLKELILIYIKLDTTYPYTLPAILGISYFEYSNTISNDKELLGRIKLLGQVLGIKDLSLESEDKTIHFDMNGKFTIQ